MDSQLVAHARALVEQWCGDFAGVMQAMGDFSPELALDFAPPAPNSNMLWWNQPMDLAKGAGIWIGAADETWSALGERILTAAGVESSAPSELKDTYLEVLQQSFGVVARAIGNRLGREITATAGTQQGPVGDLAFGCQIKIKVGDEELPNLAVHISQEMLEALQTFGHEGTEERKQAPKPAVGDGVAGTDMSTRACGTLDLLLDVELPVSVSFGRTQVRIQDILKFITGSIIELDRAISEPVEVIVNNCVIARGEVVVVEGNYGVRINEVMSRHERLQESRKYLLPAISGRQ